VDEDDIEELLEAVSEEMTNEELLELEQECVAEVEAREKETAEEGKEEFTVKGLELALADLNTLLKKFKNTDPNT
jgi:translation initiation factor 1 (eIF-1/SUI1)